MRLTTLLIAAVANLLVLVVNAPSPAAAQTPPAGRVEVSCTFFSQNDRQFNITLEDRSPASVSATVTLTAVGGGGTEVSTITSHTFTKRGAYESVSVTASWSDGALGSGSATCVQVVPTATWTPSPTATGTATSTPTATVSGTATSTPTATVSGTATTTPVLTAIPILPAPTTAPPANASSTPPAAPAASSTAMPPSTGGGGGGGGPDESPITICERLPGGTRTVTIKKSELDQYRPRMVNEGECRAPSPTSAPPTATLTPLPTPVPPVPTAAQVVAGETFRPERAPPPDEPLVTVCVLVPDGSGQMQTVTIRASELPLYGDRVMSQEACQTPAPGQVVAGETFRPERAPARLPRTGTAPVALSILGPASVAVFILLVARPRRRS